MINAPSEMRCKLMPANFMPMKVIARVHVSKTDASMIEMRPIETSSPLTRLFLEYQVRRDGRAGVQFQYRPHHEGW